METLNAQVEPSDNNILAGTMFIGGWYCPNCNMYVPWDQPHGCSSPPSRVTLPVPIATPIVENMIDQMRLEVLERRVAELERKLIEKDEKV